MEYVRITETLNDRGKFIPAEESKLDLIFNHLNDETKDYYKSIYKYNQDHFNKFKETNTVSGITDVITNKIVFDFDSKDIELARKDTIVLCDRLIKKGIDPHNIQICFSGNKGFSVELDTNKSFIPKELKNIGTALAGDLSSFDEKIYNASRLFRVPLTKHQASGLYKLPISYDQLIEIPAEQIKTLASNKDNFDPDIVSGWSEVIIPNEISSLKEQVKSNYESITVHDLDLNKKPRWLTSPKYALQEGFFQEGDRTIAMMILGSTYKNQGFNKASTYRLLKGVAETQAARWNVDRYPDEEIYRAVESIFNPTWNNGQYPKDHPMLVKVSKQLNLPVSNEEAPIVAAEKVSGIFKTFAENIDKNTMKLGITSIDKEVRITTSMLVGLLGAPSSGKTSLAINFLNYASNNNVNSIFFSLDMGAPLMFQRLIQRHEGIVSNELFSLYKNKNSKKIETIENKVHENYKNVSFCFKSGLSVDDIKTLILDRQEIIGQKIKLCVVDYLECISGPYSDSTANTSIIAQKLKDVANELDLTLVLLLQPQKHAGDPSDELLSYRNIKGSSAIEQAASVILSVWRPGFSPKRSHEDKFLSMAVLKNRMGGLNQYDFKWQGLTGSVNEITEESDYTLLKDIRANKEKSKIIEQF